MRRITAVILWTLLTAGAAGAQPADLGRGIRAYTEADYRTAVSVLESVDESQLRPDERVVLHKFLALSLLARKEREKAQEELIELLAIDPAHELSAEDLSPSVLELFQQAKMAHGARLCDRAVEAYNAGRFPEAIADFEQALRLNPRDARASEFLKLASNRVKERQTTVEKCLPVLTWGELDATSATCQGRDYSSSFELPARANRVTLIYSKHHFGVGTCWKIVLYDPDGKEVLVLDDQEKAFTGKQKPSADGRWRVVDLPETRAIARVVMHGQWEHGMEKFLGQRVGKDITDEFILGLEVTCPAEAP